MAGSVPRVLACVMGVAMGACSLITNLDGLTCIDGACADGATDSTSRVDNAETSTGTPDADRDAATDTSADTADAKGDVATDAPVDALKYTCPGSGGTVSDCATCTGSAFPCVLCANNGADRSNVVGVCVTSPSSGSACQGKGPAGYDDCLCASATDPSACVEAYQVCLVPFGPACRTCGYDGGTGLKCKGTGTCSASGVCQ